MNNPITQHTTHTATCERCKAVTRKDVTTEQFSVHLGSGKPGTDVFTDELERAGWVFVGIGTTTPDLLRTSQTRVLLCQSCARTVDATLRATFLAAIEPPK